RRRVVVLPEPDGPRSVKNSPARISRSTPSTATTSPYDLRTPTSRTAGAAGVASTDRALVCASTDTGARDYLSGSGGAHDCGSPSQQPSLNAQRGHCQVWWRHSISPLQRGQ